MMVSRVLIAGCKKYGPLEPERFSLQEANQRLAKRLEHIMRFRA